MPIISSDRCVSWMLGTDVGVRGGIPTNYTKFGSTIAAGSSSATIQAALDAAGAAASDGAGKYVLCDVGSYTITTALSVPSNVILRGSGEVGASPTIFAKTAASSIVAIGGGSSLGSQVNINSGYTKGSTQIVTASDMSLSAGDFIGITQDNESWVFDPDGTVQAIYALYRVEPGSSGTTVNIWPALLYGSTGFNPKAQKFTSTFTRNAGVEGIQFQPSGGTVGFPVLFQAAYNCWAKNCYMPNLPDRGVHMKQSLACEITHFDFNGTTSTSDGYGVVLDNQDKGNNAIAVYNCYFSGLRHGIITSGQQGSMFAYNYTVNENQQMGITGQTPGLNVSHAAEGMMSLWEGNYGNSLTSDQIHGGAAYQTLWRNRFHGNDNYYNLGKGATVLLMQGSYYWNFVGNTLGDPLPGTYWPSGGTSFYRYKFTGAQWNAALATDFGGMYMLGYVSGSTLDAAVASTAFFYSNFDYWNASQQDTGVTPIDNSLCFASKPSWFGNLAWPPFDPASPIVYGDAGASSIPAGYRYINGFDPPSSIGRALSARTNRAINIAS